MGYFYVFIITNLAMVRNFDVISAKFNGYQTSRHHSIEDLNNEMSVVGIYVNRSNTQKWTISLCNYTIDIFYWRYVVVQWVEALPYKPAGGGFDS
jgi:hypothetical protein